MSETFSGDTTFVGQADGRARPAGEAVPSEELKLNAEQQEVVDVMQKEGGKLEAAVIDAREKAVGQLKKLQGKELVDAGLKQMGHGVWETVKQEAKGILDGGLIGGLAGGLGVATLAGLSNQPVDKIIKGGIAGATFGALAGGVTMGYVGYELAGLEYNQNVARKKNLPPALQLASTEDPLTNAEFTLETWVVEHTSPRPTQEELARPALMFEKHYKNSSGLAFLDQLLPWLVGQ